MAKTKEAEARIPVTIPKVGTNEDPYVIVGINGVLTQIPRGKTVMVNRRVYNVLRQSNEARDISEKFLEANAYRSL